MRVRPGGASEVVKKALKQADKRIKGQAGRSQREKHF